MADGSEGLWISIADLARERGITRQSAAERVGRLEMLGKLTTRPGKGRAKLVNLAAFDRATADTVDGVRALNGGGSLGGPPAAPAPVVSSDPVLIREQARRAAYDADLKYLDLQERLGRMVDVTDLRDITLEAGLKMVKPLDGLPSRLDDMMAACAEGRPAGKRFLRDLGVELRTVIATSLQKLADRDASRSGLDLNDAIMSADVEE